jgi:hypothetical protein
MFYVPSKRHTDMGNTNFTVYTAAKIVCCIAKRTLFKSYNSGVGKLYCIFRGYQRVLYCDINHIKVILPMVLSIPSNDHRGFYCDMNLLQGLSPFVCDLYSIRYGYHRVFYCSNVPLKGLSSCINFEFSLSLCSGVWTVTCTFQYAFELTQSNLACNILHFVVLDFI